MKLEPVTVDGHIVEIEVLRHESGVLFIGTCGSVKRELLMAMHTDSPSDDAQHDKNVKEHAERIAKEVAGHFRNQKLLDRFFAES